MTDVAPKICPESSRNPLLRALLSGPVPAELDGLELVEAKTGEVLHDNATRSDHVWMPVTCVLSARIALPDGASMEAALYGEEGLVGMWSTVAPGRRVPFDLRVVALRGGLAWRLPVASFSHACRTNPAVQVALLALQTVLGTEALIRAICNRHHRIDRQLCRWLMLYRDRARSDDLVATHQELADILGVRREGVTEALGHLAHAGALELRRGGLRILDAARVAAGACGCYRPDGELRLSATNPMPTATNATERPAALSKAAR